MALGGHSGTGYWAFASPAFGSDEEQSWGGDRRLKGKEEKAFLIPSRYEMSKIPQLGDWGGRVLFGSGGGGASYAIILIPAQSKMFDEVFKVVGDFHLGNSDEELPTC